MTQRALVPGSADRGAYGSPYGARNRVGVTAARTRHGIDCIKRRLIGNSRKQRSVSSLFGDAGQFNLGIANQFAARGMEDSIRDVLAGGAEAISP